MTSVLLVGKGPPEAGGIPAFLTALLGSTLAAQHDVAFCNLTDDSPPQGGRLSLRNVRRTLRDTRRVWMAAQHREVVHIHTAMAPGVTCLRLAALVWVASLRGARVLVHVHGGLVADWMVDRPRRFLARAAMARAAVVITVSSAVETTLRSALGVRRSVTRIDNGVDVSAFPALGEPDGGGDGLLADGDGVPRVLYAGLLSERKGLLDLFAASRRLTADGIAHALVIAGGNHEEGPAEEARIRVAAPPGTTFTGQLDPSGVSELLRGADLLCLPSWYEAMPLIVLEAMAAGVAVVATAVGDIPRAVDDGRTGRLVPPRDVGALTAALADVLGDGRAREAYAAAGQRHVAAWFSLERTVEALDRLYRDG